MVVSKIRDEMENNMLITLGILSPAILLIIYVGTCMAIKNRIWISNKRLLAFNAKLDKDIEYFNQLDEKRIDAKINALQQLEKKEPTEVSLNNRTLSLTYAEVLEKEAYYQKQGNNIARVNWNTVALYMRLNELQVITDVLVRYIPIYKYLSPSDLPKNVQDHAKNRLS
jgi:hypothetical protein